MVFFIVLWFLSWALALCNLLRSLFCHLFALWSWLPPLRLWVSRPHLINRLVRRADDISVIRSLAGALHSDHARRWRLQSLEWFWSQIWSHNSSPNCAAGLVSPSWSRDANSMPTCRLVLRMKWDQPRRGLTRRLICCEPWIARGSVCVSQERATPFSSSQTGPALALN